MQSEARIAPRYQENINLFFPKVAKYIVEHRGKIGGSAVFACNIEHHETDKEYAGEKGEHLDEMPVDHTLMIASAGPKTQKPLSFEKGFCVLGYPPMRDVVFSIPRLEEVDEGVVSLVVFEAEVNEACECVVRSTPCDTRQEDLVECVSICLRVHCKSECLCVALDNLE